MLPPPHGESCGGMKLAPLSEIAARNKPLAKGEPASMLTANPPAEWRERRVLRTAQAQKNSLREERKMKLFPGFLLTAALSLSAAAHATIITFMDRDAFNAAAGPLNLIDFENFPDGVGVCPTAPLGSPPCSLTVGGVTFTSTVEGRGDIEFGPQLITTRSSFENRSITLIAGSGIPAAPGDFTLSFTGTAIGLDLISAGFSNWPFGFQFRESGGALTDENLVSTFGTGRFFGAISDIGFSDLSIFSNGVGGSSNFYIDNVATAATSAVPEPSMLMLLAAGMILFASHIRQRNASTPLKGFVECRAIDWNRPSNRRDTSHALQGSMGSPSSASSDAWK
jgi:hypothetical protein